jgi:hypothetical protein
MYFPKFLLARGMKKKRGGEKRNFPYTLTKFSIFFCKEAKERGKLESHALFLINKSLCKRR